MMRPSTKTILVMLTAGALMHCGGTQYRAQHAPTAAEGSALVPATLLGDDPRSQIQALDDRIKLGRTQLQLPAIVASTDENPNNSTTNPMATMSTTVPPLPQSCRQSLKPLCTDSCTLGASICDDAGKLCELTKQLQPDAWADAKCSGAKQSCDAATKRCCECR